MSESEPMTEDKHAMIAGLRVVADQVQGWIDWSSSECEQSGFTANDGTHIMSLPVPFWPSHGQMVRWVELFRHAAKEIEAREDQDAKQA